MPEISAGILLYRSRRGEVEVLLGHPGGPYFRNKDEGSWTVPKGLVETEETMLPAARREFEEETGVALDASEEAIELGEVRYRSGKRLSVWAIEGDCDPEVLESNRFEIEWPPRSGRRASFPELDRFDFFPLELACAKIHPVQRQLLNRLAERLG